jgi:hypothetical protein
VKKLLMAFLIVSGCGPMTSNENDSGQPTTDAGVAVDSGTAVADGGISLDASASDAGEPSDAGMGFDSGTFLDSGVDAGIYIDSGIFDAGAVDAGLFDAGFPMVDRTSPQLYKFQFTAAQADPDAGVALGNQLAALDTRVDSKGFLVVYLHGAGVPTTCGSVAHADYLASRGFHVVSPCYASDYGVGNCGTTIGECRLEAFDGIDRTPVISIAPSDSIEVRVTAMLRRLQTLNPKGDWRFFIANNKPRWDRIIVSGISHGASTAGVIAKVRLVSRAVMLSGPLDSNQAWLTLPPLTPATNQWGFTHSVDPQHMGHLDAFTALQLPGAPQRIETGTAPWSGSHRLFTSIDAGTPTASHSSTEAGNNSPKFPDGGYRFGAVWNVMYESP